MFHFKKINIITTVLFIIGLVLIFLSDLSSVVVYLALGTLSVAFGLLSYILIEDLIVFKQIQRETKYEMLMEVATSENGEEFIANPDIFSKKDLKRFKAQRRSKLYTIILSICMTFCFTILLIFKLITL